MGRFDSDEERLTKVYEQRNFCVRLYQHPWIWMGKWALGKIVFILYQAVRPTLYIGYYGFSEPWRDS